MNKRKHVIWDLSGTLLKTVVPPLYPQQEEILSLLLYLWGGKKEASAIDLKALEILESYGRQHGPHDQIIRLFNGHALLMVLCRWLAGKLTSHNIIEHAFIALDHDETVEHGKRKLMKELFVANFDPQATASIMEAMPFMPELIEYAHDRNYTQYAFSNWDKESFDITYRSLEVSPIFTHFERDAIVISADTGFVKPQKGIYDYLLEKYSLNPQECIFIDNQQENVAVAREYGMTAVLYQENPGFIQEILSLNNSDS